MNLPPAVLNCVLWRWYSAASLYRNTIKYMSLGYAHDHSDFAIRIIK